ncbi:hypothetical protein ACWDV4_05465 [Micromonospora sp. NPDC003197]
MRTLFNGEPYVHYGQIYVASSPDWAEDGVPEFFAGQSNGLCGAAVPGFLYLATGLHTGGIGLTIEQHDEPPPVDDSWQEIVEVSFTPETSEVRLVQWAAEASWPLDLEPVDYRVRYCGTGLDEARLLDTRAADTPSIDRYLLQFWPSQVRPDEVVKQTSDRAARRHQHARSLPPPPSPEEKAEATRRAEEEARRVREEQQRRAEARRWGGRLPTDRLRNVGGNVRRMVKLDPVLVHAIGDADPQVQRRIARWAARRAYQEAGLADLGWVAPALDALDRGHDLPWPFRDEAEAWRLLYDDEQAPKTLVTSPDGRHDNMLQQAMALPALFGAAEADPLRAALDALYAAAVSVGRDAYRDLFNEVRRAFLGTTATGP